MLIRAFFDESSEGIAGEGFLAVCGYVLSGARLRALETAWRRMLRRHKIPFFHMAECNAHSGVFGHLSKEECIDCEIEAIKIARENTMHGVAYVVRQEVYRRILEDEGFDCDPYTFLLWTALIHVSKWRDENHAASSLSLFFEQGYKTQSRADELLRYVTQDPRYRQALSVTAHGWFDKENSYAGQAADLISWHIRKGYANIASEKPVRRDTKALLQDLSTKTIHFDEVQLTILRDKFVRHSGSLERATRILFNPNGPLLER